MPSYRTIIAIMLLCLFSWSPGRTDDAPPPPGPTAPARKPGRAYVSSKDLAIEADNIIADFFAQQFDATGRVIINSPQGQYSADHAHFDQHPVSGPVGSMENVRGTLLPFHFSAKSMTLEQNGVRHMHKASLTTCSHNPPHYQLVFKDLTENADNVVTAESAGLDFGRYRLFTIPHFKQNFAEGESKTFQLPLTVGSSGLDGFYLETHHTIPFGGGNSLNYEGRLGTTLLPRGGLYYNHALPAAGNPNAGDISLVATYREDILNRLADSSLRNLTISRLPALQASYPKLAIPVGASRFSLGVGASIGRYHESPTDVTATRGQMWGILHSPDLHLGPLLFSGQYGEREAYYSTQATSHNAKITAVSLMTPQNANVYGNISYLHRSETGSSPFVFDRVQIPDELFTEIDVPLTHNGNWRIDTWNRHDLRENVSRDFSITAIYHEDCLTYSLGYDRANRGVTFGIWLNVFNNPRHVNNAIGFTQ